MFQKFERPQFHADRSHSRRDSSTRRSSKGQEGEPRRGGNDNVDHRVRASGRDARRWRWSGKGDDVFSRLLSEVAVQNLATRSRTEPSPRVKALPGAPDHQPTCGHRQAPTWHQWTKVWAPVTNSSSHLREWSLHQNEEREKRKTAVTDLKQTSWNDHGRPREPNPQGKIAKRQEAFRAQLLPDAEMVRLRGNQRSSQTLAEPTAAQTHPHHCPEASVAICGSTVTVFLLVVIHSKTMVSSFSTGLVGTLAVAIALTSLFTSIVLTVTDESNVQATSILMIGFGCVELVLAAIKWSWDYFNIQVMEREKEEARRRERAAQERQEVAR